MADQRRRQPSTQRSEPAVSIEDLHQQLKDAVNRIETGEQWQAWLDFAQRLHRYSFNNLILIWTQNPAANAVAGYNTWQSIGRQVRRGERAIRVLAPTLRRVLVEDENGQPKLDADGRKQYQRQLTGFRPAPVFDLSQTDGPPIPQPDRPKLLTGEAPDGLWDALAGEIAERGYRLLRAQAADLGNAVGRTNFKMREVWVRDDVDDAQAAKTLSHELAHILLHADNDDVLLCRGVAEVEAESVAHLVAAIHQSAFDSSSTPAMRRHTPSQFPIPFEPKAIAVPPPDAARLMFGHRARLDQCSASGTALELGGLELASSAGVDERLSARAGSAATRS